MFVYRAPTEDLDETLRRAFEVDRTLDARFETLLKQIKLKEREDSRLSG